MKFYAPFCLPFLVGALVMAAVIAWKYVVWFAELPRADKKRVLFGIPTPRTLGAVGEVIGECLLHRRIFRVNPLLGYMHMSLAFGWFLLIVVGWIETVAYLGLRWVPLQGHVFFKYFAPTLMLREKPFFDFVMDLLLLFVLSGVALAWAKRFCSRAMGMRRTTRHVPGDRIALSALWLIFPARLLAESMTSGVIWKFGGIVWALGEEHHLIPPGVGCGSFLTNSTGELLARILPPDVLMAGELPTWWFYSITLGVFFVALPFSRYMHIFTEIPLIFLRNAGLRSKEKPSSYDHFQTNACSRCGICIDPCQLQRAAGINGVQSVYFLRDLRSGNLTDAVANNCLMCGRCEQACPVGIEQNTLRLNSRQRTAVPVGENRYGYIRGIDRSQGNGKVGYFAGCMTLLTPKILRAMDDIFKASGDEVWWADKEGGVCCGRPLKLSGEVDAARKMMEYNAELFRQHGIETLVTSCPICLRVFREDYRLEGIEVLHHSEYIQRLLKAHRIDPKIGDLNFTYHDPCELGRGSGIYDAPREVIAAVGRLTEVAENREKALCCGSSLANIAIDDDGQRKIGESVAAAFAATGADAVVTACPLCKKGIARGNSMPVYDLAEIVAQAL